MIEAPRASVLLVTWNGMATLPRVLAALRAQRAGFPFEVVAVDSGSTDGSAEHLAGRVDRLIRIPHRDFDHGLTRNLGIAACRGEWVALLVQDAEPAEESWLRALVAPLALDPTLAASFARQLPRPGASALTRRALAGWVASQAEPRERRVPDRAAWDAMSPLERFDHAILDNVSSCLRRSVWERIPFRSTPLAEDLEWGREALLAGHGIAFAPAARVFHSHERGPGYEYRRTRDLHRRLAVLFGLRTIPTRTALLRALGSTLIGHLRLREGGAARALALALVWPLAQYRGGRALRVS